MPRGAITTPRTALSVPRQRVLPIGMKGRASLAFDGSDDYVTGVGCVPGTSAWTMTCWVKMANYPGAGVHYTLMTAGDPGVGAHMLDFTLIGGVPTWRAGSSAYNWASYADSLCPAVGQWRRFGFVRRAGNAPLELWLDGELRAVSPAVNPNVATNGARLGSAFTSTWFAKAIMSDARMYSRAWSADEFAADFRGEWVDPTGLVRRWTCENPGYGTTCHEEIGNTEDAIAGAQWSPNVPFRRRRVVEDVAAGMFGNSSAFACTIADHAAFKPGTGAFWLMGWCIPAVLTGQHCLVTKLTGTWPNVVGFHLQRAVSGAMQFMVADGDGSPVTVSAAGQSLAIGSPVHVAAVRDAATGLIKLYLNAGPPTTVSAATIGDVNNAADVVMGNSVLGYGTALQGERDSWLWGKGSVLTWEDIEANYYDGIIPTAPAGAVQIRWPMREGGGVTAASIPAGYDGTLSAASWTTQTRCKARPAA